MSRRSSDVDAWIAAAAARASAAVAELLQGAAPLPLGTGARQIDPDDLAEEVLCPEVWSAAVVSRLMGVASGSAGLLLSDIVLLEPIEILVLMTWPALAGWGWWSPAAAAAARPRTRGEFDKVSGGRSMIFLLRRVHTDVTPGWRLTENSSSRYLAPEL